MSATLRFDRLLDLPYCSLNLWRKLGDVEAVSDQDAIALRQQHTFCVITRLYVHQLRAFLQGCKILELLFQLAR